MPGTEGSAGNRHVGPLPPGRENKGRQGCAEKSKPGEGGGEGQGGDRGVREGFSEEVTSERSPG